MAKKTVRPETPSPAPTRRRAPASARRAIGNTINTAADMRVDSAAVTASGRTPSYDEIAEAAYRRYLERGGEHGRDFDDWVEAERFLRSR